MGVGGGAGRGLTGGEPRATLVAGEERRALRVSLKRDLGLLDVFCIAAGAMISSGLFVLPGLLYAEVGPGVWLCYLIAAVLLLPALFSKAELATALPKAGGDYFHIDRSIGPMSGMLGGLAAWAELAFKTAFALIGLGAACARVFWAEPTFLQVQCIGLGFCVVFMVVNVCGAKHAGRLQVVLVIGLLALLVGYTALGYGHVDTSRLVPVLPKRVGALLLGAAMAFVSFGGLTKVASVAEETRDPGRVLPLGMFLASGIVTAVYVGVVLVTVGVVPAEELSGSLIPIALGGKYILGRAGMTAMTVAAVLAFVSTANAGIMAASRSPLAMSRDGLLPAFFSTVGEKRGTPHWAILFTAAFIGALLFLPLDVFVKSASAMKILLFGLSIVALILLRESRVANYAPKFRSPCYPWLHVMGIVAYVFLLVELGSLPLLIATAILGCGMVWYMAYARSRVSRDSALVHLAKRIASRFFESHDLEAELAEIVLDRDGAAEDRFDHLIRDCAILDLPSGMSRDGMLERVAEHLAPHLDLPPGEITAMLRAREESTSTVIRPGLAIPHIVIEGEGHFEMLLARSREGVLFSPETPPVHAMFMLIGTRDERNYHLRALMAVAEIAQNPDFDRRWLEAPDVSALRRFVLQAKRRRQAPDEAD